METGNGSVSAGGGVKEDRSSISNQNGGESEMESDQHGKSEQCCGGDKNGKHGETKEEREFRSYFAKILVKALNAQIDENNSQNAEYAKNIQKLKDKITTDKEVKIIEQSEEDASSGDPDEGRNLGKIVIRSMATLNNEKIQGNINETQEKINENVKQNQALERAIIRVRNYIIPETIIHPYNRN